MAYTAIFSGKRAIDKLLLFYIRKIPNHPAKLRIVNILNDIIFKNFVRVVDENNMQLGISTREYLGHEIVFSYRYEPVTLALCHEILQNGGVFLDIGANIGLHTVTLSQIAGVRTFAIEPSAHNFAILLRNISINKLLNVTPINIALSIQNSFGYLTNATPDNAGAIVVSATKKEEQSYLTRLTTLKELVKYLELDNIKLIKMDIEGFEMYVLKGYFDENTTVFPENIVLEFYHMEEQAGYSERDCYDYLLALGYRSRTVDGKDFVFGEGIPEGNLWFSRD